MSRLTVTLPDARVLEEVRRLGVPGDVEIGVWDLTAPLDGPGRVDLVVVPNTFGGREGFRVLDDLPGLRVVQLSSAGYEHALPYLRAGLVLCNSRGVHDAGTAELALGLTLAAQRGIGDAVRSMPAGRWAPEPRSSLADRRVLVLGYGSVGAAIGRRLEAFETDVVRVASAAREAPEGHVHGIDELMTLLPDVDILISVLPLTDATQGLIDAALLAALPDGALVVNVGRGKVVDTQALLAELQAGRLRAALDVTDPEPLPAEHPLWRAPNTIITPHVGGYTDATTPRLAALVRRQVGALVDGREPENVVART